jgi:hypothetical protein
MQSDMAFYLELQKATGSCHTGSKRRAADALDAKQARNAPPHDSGAPASSDAAADKHVQKRSKVAESAFELHHVCPTPLTAQRSSGLVRDVHVLQDEQAGQVRQQPRQWAGVTAELALTGALARVQQDDAVELSMLEQQRAVPAQISAELPPFLLQLLLTLQASKLSMLKAVQETAPHLAHAALWDDSAAQQLLERYQTAAPLTPDLKQQVKHLVALVLMSQAAACLLHYGVRLAHLFLQHALQKLPAVAASCREAAVALTAAHLAVEQLPTTAKSGAGHAPILARVMSLAPDGAMGLGRAAVKPVDHPKLQLLQDLLQQCSARKPVSSDALGCVGATCTFTHC